MLVSLVTKLKVVQVADFSLTAASLLLHSPSRSNVFIGQQLRTFKSDLKIKWVRPEKISCIKPEKSGDLEPLPPLDSKLIHDDFKDCKLLDEVAELQKKLYTLEFLPHHKRKSIQITQALSTVQRHSLDNGSIESKIAMMTVQIRSLQQHMEEKRKDMKSKVILKELIDKRKKFLKYLRRWDYKKFEWLLEKLNIVYKPPPEEFHWITRKDSLRKLTQEHCDNIKATRLAEYRKKLDAEKEMFEKEKAEILAWIADQERICGISSSPNVSNGGNNSASKSSSQTVN